MKKLLALTFCAILSIGIANASILSNAAKTTANAVKSDVKSTANSVSNAVKTDINNSVAKRTSIATEKKEAKIKELDKKISDYNKQLNNVKNDKNITETERVIKMQKIQAQIDFYNKQKAVLK